MQQRFASGENDLPNAKIAQRRTMTIQIGHTNLLVGFPLPDVTHDAAAIAVAVNIQD